jgi:hypothetical protein
MVDGMYIKLIVHCWRAFCLSCRQISLFLAKQNSFPAQKSPLLHDNALLPPPLHADISIVRPCLPLLGLSPLNPAATKPPFSFAPVFTDTMHLGKPSRPISIFGGELINEPITSGSKSGPAINATICSPAYLQQRHAAGAHYRCVRHRGGRRELLYPRGGDWHERSAGHQDCEYSGDRTIWDFSRQCCDKRSRTGAKYTGLTDGFLLASINANKARTQVAVEVYLVESIVA